jgi:hypothetical protein
MTVNERRELLAASLPIDPDDPHSRRFAVRRSEVGLELYDAKCHGEASNGEPEFHGHPATFVPVKILRQFREAGSITSAEYRRLVRDFGCP